MEIFSSSSKIYLLAHLKYRIRVSSNGYEVSETILHMVYLYNVFNVYIRHKMLDIALNFRHQKSDIISQTSYVKLKTKYIRQQTSELSCLLKSNMYSNSLQKRGGES